TTCAGWLFLLYFEQEVRSASLDREPDVARLAHERELRPGGDPAILDAEHDVTGAQAENIAHDADAEDVRSRDHRLADVIGELAHRADERVHDQARAGARHDRRGRRWADVRGRIVVVRARERAPQGAGERGDVAAI